MNCKNLPLLLISSSPCSSDGFPRRLLYFLPRHDKILQSPRGNKTLIQSPPHGSITKKLIYHTFLSYLILCPSSVHFTLVVACMSISPSTHSVQSQ